MGTHRGRKLSDQHPRAALTLDDVQRFWFVHHGQAYRVASTPAAIFRAAVLDLAPAWRESETYGEALASAEIDLVTRWWLLCALVAAGQGIRLYGSREEAERALDQLIVH